MNKAIMKKWVKALRSGKYKHTKGQLQDVTGYCCLGVLCEISGKDYQPGGGALPDEVMCWAGMAGDMGTLPGKNRKHVDLPELNDKANYSFKSIANVIERPWRVL